MNQTIRIFLLVGITFCISVVLNIALHEMGHFVAAKSAGYSPVMSLNSVMYFSETKEYSAPDIAIAAAGQFFPVLLAIFFLVLFLGKPFSYYAPEVQVIIVVFLASTLMCIISQLLPIPGTDGYKIIYFLFS